MASLSDLPLLVPCQEPVTGGVADHVKQLVERANSEYAVRARDIVDLSERRLAHSFTATLEFATEIGESPSGPRPMTNGPC